MADPTMCPDCKRPRDECPRVRNPGDTLCLRVQLGQITAHLVDVSNERHYLREREGHLAVQLAAVTAERDEAVAFAARIGTEKVAEARQAEEQRQRAERAEARLAVARPVIDAAIAHCTDGTTSDAMWLDSAVSTYVAQIQKETP